MSASELTSNSPVHGDDTGSRKALSSTEVDVASSATPSPSNESETLGWSQNSSARSGPQDSRLGIPATIAEEFQPNTSEAQIISLNQSPRANTGHQLEADAMHFAEVITEPPTWASLAGRLRQGSGQLGPSKLEGYAYHAVDLPTATNSMVIPQQPTVGRVQNSSINTSNVPPATASPAHFRLWLGRFPTDGIIENQEVVDGLNVLLREEGFIEYTLDIERKDVTKDWAHINVSRQDVADSIVQLSRLRKVLLHGKALKADHQRQVNASNRRGYGDSSIKGTSDAEKAESKAAEKGRPRRVGKGPGAGRGTTTEAGNSSVDSQERSTEGRSRGGRRSGAGRAWSERS